MGRSVFVWLGVAAGATLVLSGPLRAEETSSHAGVSGEGDFRMYCASCHGEEGKGDGPKSFGLSVKPPDLTMLTAKYGGSFPDEKVLRMIDGRELVASHGDREMPVWGQWFKMEAEEGLGGAEGDEGTVKRRIGNLIAYIKSLQQP